MPLLRRLWPPWKKPLNAAWRAGRGEAGRLAVGFVGSAAHRVLPDILRAFRERAPGVDLTLEELTTVQQVEALGEGRIQVGFVRSPVHEEDLELRTVLEEPFLVALPEDHGLCAYGSVRLADLAEEPFVTFPRNLGAGLYDQIVGACRDAGFSPKVVQEAIQMQTQVGLVAAGIAGWRWCRHPRAASGSRASSTGP